MGEALWEHKPSWDWIEGKEAHTLGWAAYDRWEDERHAKRRWLWRASSNFILLAPCWALPPEKSAMHPRPRGDPDRLVAPASGQFDTCKFE